MTEATTFERAELPAFSDTGESEAAPTSAISKPGGGVLPSFGNIPYPPTQNPPWHPVPPCMFGVRSRVTTLYNRPVVELNGLMYRHPSLVQHSCPPGTENYTKPGTKLWAMVQAEAPSVWSLRSEANYEQKLFGGGTSLIAFIPFVGAPFDKAGGYLSYFVPQRGRTYQFSVWLRDATHGRDLSFTGPQGPRPLSLRVHVP